MLISYSSPDLRREALLTRELSSSQASITLTRIAILIITTFTPFMGLAWQEVLTAFLTQKLGSYQTVPLQVRAATPFLISSPQQLTHGEILELPLPTSLISQ